MPDRFLVVSDPPHRVDPDVNAVAQRLGMIAVEARIKLGYAFPEVWLVVDDLEEAKAAVDHFTRAGIRCWTFRAGDLLRVPAADEAKEFTLLDQGISWTAEGGARGALRWADLKAGLSYREASEVRTQKASLSGASRKLSGRLRGLSIAGGAMGGIFGAAIAGAAASAAADLQAAGAAGRTVASFEHVIEIAGVAPDGPHRVRFAKNHMSYAGLGSLKQPSGELNWKMFQGVLGERAPGLPVDRRGETGRPRAGLVQGVAIAKLFLNAPDRLKEALSDPHDFIGTFVLLMRGVAAARGAPLPAPAAPSAAPVGPRPAIEPALGDPLAQKLRSELERGDFAETARVLEATRDWDEREHLVYAFTEWPGRPEWLDRWVMAEPKSAVARTVRGRHSIAWAWEARGTATADRVKDEQFKLFFQRLEWAEKDLLRAAEMDPEDPTPHALLLTCARGLQRPGIDKQMRFMEATKRHREHLAAHEQMLASLCEKWGGSHEAMFAFAREAVLGAPKGSPLAGLIARAHVERWLAFDRKDARAYFREGDAAAEVMTAYERWAGTPECRETKRSVHEHNHFAFCFDLMQRADMAKKAFDRIGDRVTKWPWCYLGDPGEAFVRARAAAS